LRRSFILHGLRKEVDELDQLPGVVLLGVLANDRSLEVGEVGSQDARRPVVEVAVHVLMKFNELLVVTEVDLVLGVE